LEGGDAALVVACHLEIHVTQRILTSQDVTQHHVPA
jgi:hypothetical protein